MKYYVTNLRDIDYNLKNIFIAKAGKKVECTKEIYEYISKTYGDSGWFTFHKDHIKEPEAEVKEPEDDTQEDKVKKHKSHKNRRKGRASGRKAKQLIEEPEVKDEVLEVKNEVQED